MGVEWFGGTRWSLGLGKRKQTHIHEASRHIRHSTHNIVFNSHSNLSVCVWLGVGGSYYLYYIDEEAEVRKN